MKLTTGILGFVVGGYLIDQGNVVTGWLLYAAVVIDIYMSSPINRYKRRIDERRIIRGYIARKKARQEFWGRAQQRISRFFKAH